MAAHVRHGPPGSYKTASAVWIDIIGWLHQGREVYTNVRGLVDVADIETILKMKKPFPDGARIIVVDTDSHEARLDFAKFFHWLPIGAAICIDETQFIYPDRKDFKPEALDYPGGLNAATRDQRPPDIFTAIDKHRHYNWDICCTTPNIKKIPSWLRGVLESAYHHKAMDHIPIYGKRKSRIHRHDPAISGTTLNKGSQYELKRIPVTVHQLYGSTITGEITANSAESNPLTNPRFLGFLALGLVASVATFYLTAQAAAQRWGDDDQGGALALAEGAVTGARVPPGDDGRALVPAGSGELYGLTLDQPYVDASADTWAALSAYLPGSVAGIHIAGMIGNADGHHVQYLYRIHDEQGSRVVSLEWLSSAGYAISVEERCSHTLTHPLSASALRVTCAPSRERAASLASERPGEVRQGESVPSSEPVQRETYPDGRPGSSVGLGLSSVRL